MITDLTRLEELIRAGDFSTVAKAIAKLNAKKVPREIAARVANLANRVDQSRLALKILHPLVKSTEQELSEPLSEAERLEYGEALRRMGLLNEALSLFQQIDVQHRPSVLLNISFCYFNDWKYTEAIPHLRRLIGLVDPTEYLSTVAKVNLAAALVHQDSKDEALDLLKELQNSTRKSNQLLLLGNCLELAAQVHISHGEWQQADQVLTEATQVLSRDSNKYSSFVQKHRAIAKSMQSGRVEADLLEVRAKAGEREDWETQRDCDLYIATIDRNHELLQKLYFGTPQTAFRRRILGMAGETLQIPPSFVWSQKGPPQRTFDLLSGACDDGQSMLETAGRAHQLMLILARDFYRPFSIGSIFNSLFAGESFGQEGSANRVWQIVRRLRCWLEAEKLGFRITEHNGKYRFEIESGFGLRVSGTPPQLDRDNIIWEKLKNRIPPEHFTRRDLEQISATSPATTKRILRWAIDSGHIESLGFGPHTTYRLVG